MAINIGGSIGSNVSDSSGVVTDILNVTKNTTLGTKDTVNKFFGQLRYPLNMRIEKNTDYLRIEIVKYEPPGYADLASIIKSIQDVSSNSDQNKNNQGQTLIDQLKNTQSKIQGKEKTLVNVAGPTIFLPIPSNLNDANSVAWGPNSLDPFSMFGVSIASGLITKPVETANNIINQIQNTKDINDNVKKSAIAALSSTLINNLGGNVSTTGLISRATGQIFNPNLELLFEGVNLRAFPFTFDFAPRSKKEGEVVKQIIRNFKKNMMPKKSKDDNVFISAPNVFKVSYMTGNVPHPFLNKFRPMALTDISLSYTGSGTYATYYDGTPVHIQMTLTFKELDPIYAESYDEKEAEIGVGY